METLSSSPYTQDSTHLTLTQKLSLLTINDETLNSRHTIHSVEYEDCVTPKFWGARDEFRTTKDPEANRVEAS